ncbi:MFS transporter [Pyronema omphalodes]|nr:MFS transporter [Pyronema omphalodes]
MSRPRIRGNAAFQVHTDEFSHIIIQDAQQRKALELAAIDAQPFGWQHVKAIVIGGIGFFTDSYDIFAVNLTVAMLGISFWQDGLIPEKADTAIKLATSVGTIFGQICFGILADKIGRGKMYGSELMIIIAATFVQSLASNSPSLGIVPVLVLWRVIMGIGIGGDYPLSSIITSEYATTKWRGAMMGAVFAMQGVGQFGAAIFTLIVTELFQSQTKDIPINQCDGSCKIAVDRMWRIIIGFGAIPACFALYYRLTCPETPRYTINMQTQDNVEPLKDLTTTPSSDEAEEEEPSEVRSEVVIAEEAPATASFADFRRHYGQWKNLKILIGTAGSWFFLDVAFYGLGLNNSVVLQAIGFRKENTVYKRLHNNAVGNLIMICAGSLPGYWVSVFTVDRIGRKRIQVGGFIILTVLFFIIGFSFHSLSSNALLALYCLCQFFFNFGPNATTFIVPGEVFPTRYRSTSHGISAASGKFGAVVAQVLIGPLRVRGNPTPENPSPWLNWVMVIFGAFMACGIVTSFLIPETARRTLEEISDDPWGKRKIGDIEKV